MQQKVIVIYETVEELLKAMKSKTSSFRKHHAKVVLEGIDGLYVTSDDDCINLGGELVNMPSKLFVQKMLEAHKLPIEVKG